MRRLHRRSLCDSLIGGKRSGVTAKRAPADLVAEDECRRGILVGAPPRS